MFKEREIALITALLMKLALRNPEKSRLPFLDGYQ
jgi:hypothetical protein